MKIISGKFKSFFVALIFMISMPAFGFEDVIITNSGKLTDIKIENHEIIDVFPLITIMNDKNTIIVHPLKEGQSKFTTLREGKKLIMFSVKVEADKTTINSVNGFDILPIDAPPGVYEYELDLPPIKVQGDKWIN